MCFLCTDPFAEAGDNEDSGKDYVHIRVQQRNGKKSLTTIQVRQCAFVLLVGLSQNLLLLDRGSFRLSILSSHA